MKRILSLILALGIVLGLAGCGKKDRVLYNVNLKKYVDLGDYKGLEIDTSSDEYKEYYDSIIADDVENNKFYVQDAEGKVENGDTVHIDYEGKLNGEAFEGGTDTGYDLEIGSGTFIEGFEEALIGVEIGETVDIDVTFPEDYGNEELNGKDVVFTVTVWYVLTDEPLDPEDYYMEMDYETVEDYYADIKQTAIEWLLLDAVTESSQIKEYPQEDLDYLLESYVSMYETNIYSTYQVDLDTYLGYVGYERETFEESLIEDEIKPMMETYMVVYLIFDKERLSYTEDEYYAQVDHIVETINSDDVDRDAVVEYYGEYYFEQYIVNEKVTDFLYKNAKIS